MSTVQRFISTMMLGGMTLAMVPAVAAEETSADVTVRSEMRLELKACNAKETAEERRTCAKAVHDKYKELLPSLGERIRRGIGRILPPVLQGDMKECKKNDDKETRKECMKTARDEFKSARTDLRDGLTAACGTITDLEEKKECAKQYAEEHNMKNYRLGKPAHKLMKKMHNKGSDIRKQLQDCRDEHDDDFAAFKICIEEVRASIKASIDAETEVSQ